MGIYDLFALIGGLGLVLYGMRLMSDGLEKAAGEKLRKLMGVLTSNRFMGLLVGMIVAAVIQSSGATVMVVGFVNAGLMTLSQAVGVIMGTNVGTTLFAQVMSLDISDIAPLFIMLGVLPMMFSKVRNRQMVGQIMAGFGILFCGMTMMSGAMEPLRTMPAFQQFMLKFSNPFLGVLLGTVVTAVIQSSAASVAILQSLAIQGLITLDSAVFLVLGFNIGTTSSALIGCIGSGRSGRRAAIMHTSIKAVGAVLFIIFIQFVPLVSWLEKISPGNVAWQIANVHLVFNLINTVVLFPFADLFVKLALRVLPMTDSEKTSERHLQYINDNMLSTPAIAVSNLLLETARMGNVALRMFQNAVRSLFDHKDELVEKVSRDEKIINELNSKITAFLVKISQCELTQHDSTIVGGLYHIVSDIERMGDHAENITEYTMEMRQGEYEFSDVAREELGQLAETTQKVVENSLYALEHSDVQTAQQGRELEREVDALAKRFRQNHIDRMREEVCDPVSGTIFTDMIINLERISDHADNICERVITQHV